MAVHHTLPVDDDPAARDPSTQLQLRDLLLGQLGAFDRFVWRMERHEWWIYQNGVWRPEDAEQVSAVVEEVVFGTKPGAAIGTIDAVKRLLRTPLAVPATHFDRLPHLLPVANGVVDLETFELLPASPGMFITRAAPTPYIPHVRPCPLWRKHLDLLFNGDEEVVHCFHKQIGAALMGDAEALKPQVFVYLIGPSGSGKGTAMRIISKVMGEGQHVANFTAEDFTAKGSSRHRQWLTRMNGVRIAIVEEAKSDAIDVAQLKKLSGGDPVIANEMRRADKAWTPSHTLFFTSNVAPNFAQDPDGMRRRYVPLPTGPFRKPVEGYERELLAEAQGILAWLVEGCRLWRLEDAGGTIHLPERVRALRDVHIADHSPFDEFIEERLLFDPNASAHRDEVRSTYARWLAHHGGTGIIDDQTMSKLYAKLDQNPDVRPGSFAIPERNRTKSRGWKGLGLREELP